MESASKLTKSPMVKKPLPKPAPRSDLELEQAKGPQQAKGSRSIDSLPSGPGTSTMRQAAVLQLQRTHGNAHVMRQLQPTIQRQEEEGAAAGPSSISSGGASVETGGGGVEITGGTVKVHSGYTEVDGVLKTNTIIAENVVGSSYTPGAGNIW